MLTKASLILVPVWSPASKKRFHLPYGFGKSFIGPIWVFLSLIACFWRFEYSVYLAKIVITALAGSVVLTSRLGILALARWAGVLCRQRWQRECSRDHENGIHDESACQSLSWISAAFSWDSLTGDRHSQLPQFLGFAAMNLNRLKVPIGTRSHRLISPNSHHWFVSIKRTLDLATKH